MAVVALLAITAAACAKPDNPGVGVDPIAADIVFGVKDVDPSAPANASSPQLTPETASEELLLDEFLESQPTKATKKSFPRPQPTKVDCPGATIDEFPDEPAADTVPMGRLPKEGIYRWKRQGSQKLDAGGDPLPISGFEERLVRNVTVIAQTDAEDNTADRLQYTFQTVQPEMATGLIVITDWFVDSNPAADTEVNNNSPAVRANVGEPERGLVIRKIERKTAKDDRIQGGTTQFAPGGGLLMLPLKIRQGEKWESSAVDTLSGRTVRLSGQVRDRERVDACGEIIDGWRVQATFEGDSSARRTYNYIVAPQLGAILLAEHWEGRTSAGTASIDYTIGQKDPSPAQAAEG